MIKGWMHIAMMNNGYEIACELHGRLLQSGLYEASDTINVAMVGDMPQQSRFAPQQSRFANYVLSRWPKYVIIYQSARLEDYEWPCLMHLRSHTAKTDNVYYIHTKGASNDSRPDVPSSIQDNIRQWRHLMCRYVIEDWHLCNRIVDGGRGHDACGALYDNNSHGKFHGPHFAGNFWWASGHHVNRLPAVFDTSVRNTAETFITSIPGNYYNLASTKLKDYYGFDGGKPFLCT